MDNVPKVNSYSNDLCHRQHHKDILYYHYYYRLFIRQKEQHMLVGTYGGLFGSYR